MRQQWSRVAGIPLCWALALICGLLRIAMAVPPPLPPEAASVQPLPWPTRPHWVWIDDIAFFNMPDGRATLVDGDTGKVLGMLSTGYNFNAVVIPKSDDVIYAPETYYSRGTRGVRTDVVTLYDARRLAPIGEILIPPERAAIMPMRSGAALTDDGRFLLIYNYTPAQSVSVVDTRSRRFVGKIETAGCALVYPVGARRFFSICADGALLEVSLDDAGRTTSMTRSTQLFDPQKDPLAEEGVRSGDTWWFTSFNGWVYPVEATGRGVHLGARWSLFSSEERASGWRTGGLQYLGLYRPKNWLYVIVHRGGLETHKDPGKEVWVYDLARRRRVRQLELRNEAGSILLSQDAKPLLYTCFLESDVLDVYDALSGRYLRSVSRVAETPTVMVAP